VTVKEIKDMKEKDEEQRKRKEKKSYGKLSGLGFEPEHSGEVLF
jgi:U6 snRNA-associated Sm-like protein LSm1